MRTHGFVSSLAASVALTLTVPASAEPAPKLKGPVQVFILAGQSNMEGQGIVAGEKPGTLETLLKDPASAPRFKHLADANGKWIVRDDVWIWYHGRTGGLTVGYSPKGNAIGPELQFGHVVGDAFDQQILLIKTAWGGKSLGKDFRPPSAGGEVGPYYTQMMAHVKEVLGGLKTLFPAYDGKGCEIAGFGWHPEFKGNVAFVGTKDFWRPKEASPSGQGYHWNNNAETYFLIGDGMGKAMLKLLGTK